MLHMAVKGKNVWREIFPKFLSYRDISDQENRTSVNAALDQLNAEEYAENFVTDPCEILDFINKGCALIPVDKTNSFLLSKFFQLVGRILLKQKVILDDRTLNNLLQHVVISGRCCPNISIYDSLKLLGELLFENGVKCQKFYQELLAIKPPGLLFECCSSRQLDIECQKAAIICIGNLCVKDSNGSIIDESYGEIGLLAILKVLQTPPRKDVIKIEHCKLINVCLKAIQDILSCIRTLLKRHLGQLLLTIKNYIFYGFPDYELPYPNYVTSESSSPRDSSSDMEPDDLSLLKVSLNPVKERAFPARGALKKKARQKRGKRQKYDKNNEHFEDGINVSPVYSNNAVKAPDLARTSRGRYETRSEKETVNVTSDTATVLSWRNREPEQKWRLDDSVNSQQGYPTSSSESEFSDSETGQVRRLRSATARVRNTSLVCLQAVIKISDRKDLFGFWSSFISDGSGALTWSLFNIIQNDPNIKNRIGAISVLMDLLDGSKPFLAAADDSDQHHTSSSRPFTPFSSRLGSMVHELHRLLDFIPTETSVAAQSQLVKCLALLVLNCPYEKLQRGLLSRIVETIRPLLKKNDMSLKQSCLVCLSAVLTINAPLSEVVETMQETSVFPLQNVGKSSAHAATLPEPSGFSRSTKLSAPSAMLSGLSVRTSEHSDATQVPSHATPKPSDSPSRMTATISECSFPWLVSECFSILMLRQSRPNDKENISVDTLRSEVLLLLIVFVRNYFNLLREVVPQISLVAIQCLHDCNSAIKVNAIKVLQELARVMYQTFSVEEESLRDRICEFWLKLLEGDIIRILQSKDLFESKSKSAACDCLSDLGARIFEELTIDKRILIITMLLGLVNDEDSYVRAASLRALGVYVLYPVLRENTVFVTDTANAALNGLHDSVLLVRMRAAWCMANLSDALVINKNSDGSMFVYEFSESVLLRMINITLMACDDSEKVRCNVVRTLGNVAKYLSGTNMEKQTFVAAIEKIFEALSKCILNGQMKTRWNACYAAGNVYSNPSLPNGQTSTSIQMLDAILSVVSSCKNFKVRINAVNALAVPASRSCYGDEKQFTRVWCCLTETLTATKNISDFSEFKYRDNLREQICGAICHITSLLAIWDLTHIVPTVQLHQEDLIQHLTNFYQKQLKQDEESSTKGAEVNPVDRYNNPFLVAYEHVMAMSEESQIVQNIFIEAKSCARNAVRKEMGT